MAPPSTDPDDEIELRTFVRPSNVAPIAAKLWENAFRTICNFRFFDAKKIFSKFFFEIFRRFFIIFVRFWRSEGFLDVKIEFLEVFLL